MGRNKIRQSQEITTMSHKILIVEDNENNRSLLRDILTFQWLEEGQL